MIVSIITYILAQIGPNSEYSWTRLIYSTLKAPTYHLYFELVLIIGIIWLSFKRSYRIFDDELTAQEKNELINEWTPVGLVPEYWKPSQSFFKHLERHAYSAIGKYVDYQPHNSSGKLKKHLNFATFNFLNYVGNPEIAEVATAKMRKYGVGSCGPRGFYGTFDAHIDLENQLARFLCVEKAVLYAYGMTTISSVIPSYAKRTDVIFADAGINHAIYQGLVASRSEVKFFKHNDMAHLEDLLKMQAELDRLDPKRAMLTRRFIVVEGLCINYGDICPLPELISLKYKYKVRIILDESISFGVLGKTGRGITEYFSVDIEDVDLISGSLENALGICGGFCAGSRFVVGHQELSSQAYCFSASLPPMLVSAAQKSLYKLKSSSGVHNQRLLELSHLADHLFHADKQLTNTWKMCGHLDSPVKHLRLRTNNCLPNLEAVVEAAFEWADYSNPDANPLLLTVARHTPITKSLTPEPSIRITLNCDLTDGELSHLFNVISSLTPRQLS